MTQRDDDFSEAILAIKLTIDSATKTGSNRPLIGIGLVDCKLNRLVVGDTTDNDRFHSLFSIVSLYANQSTHLSICYAVDPKVPNFLKERFETCIRQSNDGQSTNASRRQFYQVKYSAMTFDHHSLQHALSDRLINAPSSLYVLSSSAPFAWSTVQTALDQLNKQSSNQSIKFRVQSMDFQSHLTLDAAALQALNLFPSTQADNQSMHQSDNLFGLLNVGKSVMSSRLLSTWLRQPLRDIASITQRLDLLECFVQHYELRAQLIDGCFKKLPDFDRLIRSFQRGKAGLQQILILWQFTQRLPSMIEALQQTISDLTSQSNNDAAASQARLLDTRYLDRFTSMSAAFDGLDRMVQTTIDMDALNRHEYLISSRFDPELSRLAKEQHELMKEMETINKSIMEEFSLSGRVKIVDAPRDGGYCMRCTQNDERELRNVHSIISLEAKKEGFKFTTNKFKRLSAEYVQSLAAYQDLQKQLVEKAVSVVNSYLPVLEESAELVAEVDLMCGLAHVFQSSPQPYVRPTILPAEDNRLELVQARHPCMEASMDGSNFIPNDVRLNSETRRTLIVTGPNMAGKSSFIRMVGLIQVMCQCGLYVPCASATVSLRDRVLTRIGAGDAQLKGVSTFMREMSEAATILNQSTAHSLVVIDELGRGTSSADGFALAWSITAYANDTLKCTTLISTHYHELTEMELHHVGVANCHCEVLIDHDRIVMSHLVKPGPIGKSFGVHCAQMAHLPPAIIDMARIKTTEYENLALQQAHEDKASIKQTNETDEFDIVLDASILNCVTPEEAIVLKQYWRACMNGDPDSVPLTSQLAQKIMGQ